MAASAETAVETSEAASSFDAITRLIENTFSRLLVDWLWSSLRLCEQDWSQRRTNCRSINMKCTSNSGCWSWDSIILNPIKTSVILTNSGHVLSRAEQAISVLNVARHNYYCLVFPADPGLMYSTCILPWKYSIRESHVYHITYLCTYFHYT